MFPSEAKSDPLSVECARNAHSHFVGMTRHQFSATPVETKYPSQVGVNVLGAPAHVVLLEATNSFTNTGFEFSQRSYSAPPSAVALEQKSSFVDGT